jgi:hypothetical protein
MDLSVYRATVTPVPADILADPVRRKMAILAAEQTRESAAFKRAETYFLWAAGPGACASGSRGRVSAAAGLLVFGCASGIYLTRRSG